MKLKMTIEITYEVSEGYAKECYGTTDPAECARIEQDNIASDPGLLADFLTFNDTLTTKVEILS